MTNNTTMDNKQGYEAFNTQTKCSEKNILRKRKIIQVLQTILLMFSWSIMGMVFSIQGTTMPEFRTRLNTTVEGLSYAMSFGSIGSLMATPLYILADRLGSFSAVLMCTFLTVGGTFHFLKIFCSTVIGYGCCDFIAEICWSTMNTVGSSMVMAIWKGDGSAAMHALHLGFPIGSFIGPLLAGPFLSKNITDNDNGSAKFKFSSSGILLDNVSDDNSRIEALYSIQLILTLLVASFYIPVQIIWSPKKVIGIGKRSYSWKEAIHPSKWAQGDAIFGIKILACLIIYYILLKGALKGTSQFLVTYAVDSDLGFNNQQAAVLSSVVNGMGVLSRALAIVVAQYVSIKLMLFTELHAQFICSILMTICVYLGSKTGMYVFLCAFGFFSDPVWPGGFAWTDNYIILLSTVLGISRITSGIADIFQTSLQGYLYENWAIESVFYTTVIYSSLMCLLLYFMFCLTWRRPTRYEEQDKVIKVTAEDIKGSSANANIKNKIFVVAEHSENTYL